MIAADAWSPSYQRCIGVKRSRQKKAQYSLTRLDIGLLLLGPQLGLAHLWKLQWQLLQTAHGRVSLGTAGSSSGLAVAAGGIACCVYDPGVHSAPAGSIGPRGLAVTWRPARHSKLTQLSLPFVH